MIPWICFSFIRSDIITNMPRLARYPASGRSCRKATGSIWQRRSVGCWLSSNPKLGSTASTQHVTSLQCSRICYMAPCLSPVSSVLHGTHDATSPPDGTTNGGRRFACAASLSRSLRWPARRSPSRQTESAACVSSAPHRRHRLCRTRSRRLAVPAFEVAILPRPSEREP